MSNMDAFYFYGDLEYQVAGAVFRARRSGWDCDSWLTVVTIPKSYGEINSKLFFRIKLPILALVDPIAHCIEHLFESIVIERPKNHD
jgi:hypothetical protein